MSPLPWGEDQAAHTWTGPYARVSTWEIIEPFIQEDGGNDPIDPSLSGGKIIDCILLYNYAGLAGAVKYIRQCILF